MAVTSSSSSVRARRSWSAAAWRRPSSLRPVHPLAPPITPSTNDCASPWRTRTSLVVSVTGWKSGGSRASPQTYDPAVAFLDPDAVARLLRPRTVVGVESLGSERAPIARAVLDDGSTVVVKERRREQIPGWGCDPG